LTALAAPTAPTALTYIPTMALELFHPAVARWFHENIGEPTPAQIQGWAAIRAGDNTLIAAPTGSGKTLAAFLHALDELLREGLAQELPEETRIVYVSPLKALSADIHKNLAEPRREIRQLAEAMGLSPARISAAVRTGDTPSAERAAMIKHPPHILVTTPESLYLLLTAERSREMLKTVRTVIVDEIHAMIESRRGAHLALSLERLDHVAGRRIQRIGLSATQKPIEIVAEWLDGGKTERRNDGMTASADESSVLPTFRPSVVINQGHKRTLDIALELPGSPLEAVMSGEVWEEVYQRLTDLINQHKTTIVFVNTRRLAERLAMQLAERLGEAAVTAHHGSMSKELRLDAEERLKAGKLRALVATASLELGIDIGHVDLVCQIASPRRIATFLQRVGRSGHTVSGTPKGRLFPLTRDDLVECAALILAVRRGELDHLVVMNQPLDVLAQQVVAESAAEDWELDRLFELFRGAYPYRSLTREEFDDVVRMTAQGFTTKRGRRGALVHLDAINGRIRGRRGARLTAITSGGAIPENADYRVVLEPEGIVVGTLNEDFAIESSAGDIFQLGNTSWRILQVSSGKVRVEDARGEPPTIPFWLGEAPTRSVELSAAVAHLRQDVEARLGDEAVEAVGAVGWLVEQLNGSAVIPRAQPEESQDQPLEDPKALVRSELEIPRSARDDSPSVLTAPIASTASSAAEQMVAYFAEARRMLGALPSQDTIVMERFFDEAGGMQLVIHSPFGSRVNRAWGLALRKRFCRSFNFELQAAATDEALLLSLGPQHSFPLEDVFRFLHPNTVKDILVQALLDAPVFGTRWRWNANISLAVPRNRGGAKIPPQIQRMMSEDLLAAVFPDAAACLENIPGDREIPDHPLARQTIDDCLHEAMDIDRLIALLEKIHRGELTLIARDLPEPSPLAHEILNAKPYAFLDDAPLEERRTQAVITRRALDPSSAADLGALDQAAIDRVREEAWPDPRDADEMHDSLMMAGFLLDSEAAGRQGDQAAGEWEGYLQELGRTGRAAKVGRFWVATERRAEILAVNDPNTPERATAIRELIRGRMEILGPKAASDLAESLGIIESDADIALAELEREGVVLRGSFTPNAVGRPTDRPSGPVADLPPGRLEWCDRRLLARIHRYTLNRLRSEIAPVSASEFMRFLLNWQRLDPDNRVRGLEGLAAVLTQLDGVESPAASWESDVLGARCDDYDPMLLDTLCLTGRVMWGRLSKAGLTSGGRPIRSTPIALFQRPNAAHWLSLGDTSAEPEELSLSSYGQAVLDQLRQRGASFFHDLVQSAGLLPTQVEQALGELAALGLVTSDSFAGLRALLVPSAMRKPFGSSTRRHRMAAVGVESAGRWSLLRSPHHDPAEPEAIATLAWTLLRRYGVVFKRVLSRESLSVGWRQLAMTYRRLEARGEIRGGRFVSGMSGEQFALPEAVGHLRTIRREGPRGQLISISAADPLNLVGVVTPGERVAALRRNRILFEDGVPLAALEGGVIRQLNDYPTERAHEIERALIRRRTMSSVPKSETATG